MVIDSGKWSSSGFVLLDCPQSMKIESSSASLVGSISDYFLSLSNGWDLTSFLKSLSKVLKSLKLGSCFTPNSKEGNSSPCTVNSYLLLSLLLEHSKIHHFFLVICFRFLTYSNSILKNNWRSLGWNIFKFQPSKSIWKKLRGHHTRE